MYAQPSLDLAHRREGDLDLAQVATGVDPVKIAPVDSGEREASSFQCRNVDPHTQLDILLLEPHALTGQLAAAATTSRTRFRVATASGRTGASRSPVCRQARP